MFNKIDKLIKFGVKEGICYEGELHNTLNSCLRYFNEEEALEYVRNYFSLSKLNFDINAIPYYDISIYYFEGNLCKYKDHVYLAKQPKGLYGCKETNIAQLPPEYPIIANEFWKLIK